MKIEEDEERKGSKRGKKGGWDRGMIKRRKGNK